MEIEKMIQILIYTHAFFDERSIEEIAERLGHTSTTYSRN
jgi:DNA-directed RNA polymerase specialized sigma subunit